MALFGGKFFNAQQREQAEDMDQLMSKEHI